METKNIKTIIKDSIPSLVESLEQLKNNVNLQTLGEPIIIKNKKELEAFKHEDSKLNHLQNKCNIIYLIKVENKNNYSNIVEEFFKFKNKKEFNTCREKNGNNWVNCNEKYLYVGSCKENIKSRLMQHFGFKSKSTYALHLNEWWDFERFGGIEIIINEVLYLNNDALQVCEDILWDYYKPILGKQGKK